MYFYQMNKDIIITYNSTWSFENRVNLLKAMMLLV